MRRITIALTACIAAISPCLAGGDAYPLRPYYREEAPPITVRANPYYPPPPAYAAPNPIVGLGAGIGGIVGGAVALPFQFLGGLFGALTQSGPAVPDGAGGYVPIANSGYDPATGQFLPPAPYPPPATLYSPVPGIYGTQEAAARAPQAGAEAYWRAGLL